MPKRLTSLTSLSTIWSIYKLTYFSLYSLSNYIIPPFVHSGGDLNCKKIYVNVVYLITIGSLHFQHKENRKWEREEKCLNLIYACLLDRKGKKKFSTNITKIIPHSSSSSSSVKRNLCFTLGHGLWSSKINVLSLPIQNFWKRIFEDFRFARGILEHQSLELFNRKLRHLNAWLSCWKISKFLILNRPSQCSKPLPQMKSKMLTKLSHYPKLPANIKGIIEWANIIYVYGIFLSNKLYEKRDFYYHKKKTKLLLFLLFFLVIRIVLASYFIFGFYSVWN